MPLASDSTTGTRETVDRDIIAAAAAGSSSRGSGASRQSSSPITQQADHLRGPDHPSNSTGHTNPVPSILYSPTRAEQVQREMADQLAMKAGALTTIPEVEEKTTGVAAWDARLAQRAGQVPDQVPSYGAGARAGNQSARLATQKAVEQEEMDSAFAGFKSGIRATRRGVNQGGSTERVKALSSEAYAAMSPQQKAAVELNSMLTAAIEADMPGADGKGVGHPNPGKPAKNEEGKQYEAAVEKLFTGEGETAPYAPNTVGVLENIGWSSPATDLEDILSGKLLFTREDIRDLAKPREGVAPDASLNTSEKMRDEIQASLVKAFTTARKEPIQGKNLLGAKQELLNYEDIPGFKDTGREVVPGVSVGKFIQSGFDMLANSNSTFTADQIIADARANLDDKEFEAFLNFVDINSRDAKKFRQPLGSTEGQTYFDPVEFRKEIATALRGAR